MHYGVTSHPGLRRNQSKIYMTWVKSCDLQNKSYPDACYGVAHTLWLQRNQDQDAIMARYMTSLRRNTTLVVTP